MTDNTITFPGAEATDVTRQIAEFLAGGVGQEPAALFAEVGRRWPSATESQVKRASRTAADMCRNQARRANAEADALMALRKGRGRRPATIGSMQLASVQRLLGWSVDDILTLTGISAAAYEELCRQNTMTAEDEAKLTAALQARRDDILTRIGWAAGAIGAKAHFDYPVTGSVA